jgi:hypothetical protein
MAETMEKTEQELKEQTGLGRRKRKARAQAAAGTRWERWAQASEEERAEYLAKLSSISKGHGRPRDRAQPRCRCQVMTLKRARARGAEAAHKPTCTFYPKS